jgi:ribosomal protein S12 methylthiotransferase
MLIYLSNLGCARNLVDGEIMSGELADNGYTITPDPAKADTIIVNTCSFIESAVDESVDEILELAEYKKTGNCKRLIVTGCLPERFREETADSLSEVDIFLGTGAYHKITDVIKSKPIKHRCLLPPPMDLPLQGHDTKRIPATSPMAYLKVTEGCNRHCTYCIIPKLRGRLRSRSIEDIAAEAKHLISSGFKEIVIIGQDTGAYGTDLEPPVPFSHLLEKIANKSVQKSEPWIRFLYVSPDMTD